MCDNFLPDCLFWIVHTGLLALQGKDELGKYLRSNLKKLGVSTEFIKGEWMIF